MLTQFAVDRALTDLRANGTLVAGKVARVAIVGPGLDFADKQEGFDFYQPQTLQPFTVIDSVQRPTTNGTYRDQRECLIVDVEVHPWR